MKKILIGPAGSGGSDLQNFEKIKSLGLDAVEIEFTYGVWLTKEKAKQIAELNKKLKLKLSIHAPYFINLNSEDKAKFNASKSRILKSCEIGHYLNAKEIVFHPGFYQKKSPEETYKKIEKSIKELQKTIKEKKYNVKLCPETTGKPSQFGSLSELIRLRKNTNCGLTVDFAHLKARNKGVLNYPELMKKLKQQIPFHSHFSGIEYTLKGERKHLLTQTKDIKELLQNLLKYKINTTIINESPSPLEDALKMKKILRELKTQGNKF
jgi:deoxyribonuclease IV